MLFFSFASLYASATQVELHSKGDLPPWVKTQTLPTKTTPAKPSQVNLQYLLIDTQQNIEEKVFYRHFAIKAITQNGTQALSQIKIDFDPSYNRLVMHHIDVIREGKRFDRLESAHYNLIQRETELERNLYNGNLTLIYFLNDIREGDIVEYSYSILGNNPLATSHYTDWVYMQRASTVEKMTHRLLANPNLTFSTKQINTEVAPLIRDLSPSIREWIWEATETPPYVEEQNQPVWYNLPASIQMSEYRSWKEVIKTILPLYSLPEDFCSSEMHDLVEKWQKSSPDLSKQALLALRFVQDEIRYLGFEDGMRAFKPTHPASILKRRFGDCKDKTFLLHALLKSMDIPSKIILVHTTRGKTLPDVLPSPFVFNHVVLQLEIANTTYYVDPTWSLQGGSLEKNFFPDYAWGLVLEKKTANLISLPKPIVENPTEIDSHFTVLEEDVAHLKMKTTFYGADADRIRRALEWQGLEKVSQYYLSQIQDVYGAASLKTAMEASDDRENNSVILIESYNLPTRVVQDRKKLDLLSRTIWNYLYSSINPKRSSPCEIPYPLWVKERIQVETPFMEWASFRDSSTKAHEAFFYHDSLDIEKNQACFNFELKHLQDHIPKHALSDSWQILSEISREGLPCVTVATPHTFSRNVNFLFLTSLVALIIWIPVYFISRKKRPTQDGLSFHLRKFQVFYMLLNIFSLVALRIKPPYYAIVAVAFILIAFIQIILAKRSVWLVFSLQVCLFLQTCVIGFLLFTTMPNIHLGYKLTAICIYCLYSITIVTALNQARIYLTQEKKAERITI